MEISPLFRTAERGGVGYGGLLVSIILKLTTHGCFRPFVNVSVCLFVNMSVFWFAYFVFVCLFCPFFGVSVFLVCLILSVFVCLSFLSGFVCLYVCLFVCLPVCLFACLTVSLFVCFYVSPIMSSSLKAKRGSSKIKQ